MTQRTQISRTLAPWAFVIGLLLLFAVPSLAQETPPEEHLLFRNSKLGKMYVYWGWNRGWFSRSDISFKGDTYDFVLKDVVAKDRQTDFSLNGYLNPLNATVPQYNFRVGYYFRHNLDISIGIDHMKYVVVENQIVHISGSITNTGTAYDGDYYDELIQLKRSLLLFEHTDGLNYLNIEIRKTHELFDWKNISINLTEGFGVGILAPGTNVTLLNNARHDQFHLAGYGLGAVVGFNITFFNSFFIQTEMKGGFISMPDINITDSRNDSAHQKFFFSQYNVVVGGYIDLHKNKSATSRLKYQAPVFESQ